MIPEIQQSGHVSELVKDVGVPLFVAAIGLAGSLLVAALSFALGRWAETTGRRRNGYCDVKKALVKYREYCWRIRRRTSDEPEELRRLAEIGHEIQEELAYCQLWTRAENAFVGRIFREVRADLARELGPACKAAWAESPIAKAADMTLGDWGPDDLDSHLDRFDSAVAFRFGWRRLLAILRLHIGVMPRPAQNS